VRFSVVKKLIVTDYGFSKKSRINKKIEWLTRKSEKIMKQNIKSIYFAKTKKVSTEKSSTSAITGVSIVRANVSLSEEVHKIHVSPKKLQFWSRKNP